MMHLQHPKKGINSLVTSIILWKSTFAHGILVALEGRNESCHHIRLRDGQGSTVSHSHAIISIAKSTNPLRASLNVGFLQALPTSQNEGARQHLGHAPSAFVATKANYGADTDTRAPKHPNPTRNRYRVVDKICSPEVPKASYPRPRKDIIGSSPA